MAFGYTGICLMVSALAFVTPSGPVHKRNVIKNPERIWPTWQIPYTVQRGLSRSLRNQFLIAMNRISRRTCLAFHQRKNEPDYIHFELSSACSSDLGRQGGRQTISIGPSCSSPTNIVHELIHALGFMHEQQRPDRDNFVEILWDNIRPEMRYNFRVLPKKEYYALGPYDYNSIMHYRSSMFAKTRGLKTIRAKRPVAFIGFMNDLSELDIWKINKVYRCNQTQCTHPTLPKGGILTAENIEVGRAKVEYSCKNNSDDIVTTLVGSHYRYCTKSAEWSGRLPACLESVNHYCDFDEELCGWTQGIGDSADWQWKKGKADSKRSGPYQDHSLGFGNYGRYMLLSSHNVRRMMKAFLRSPSLSLPRNQTLCLRYYYYMSGYRMGNLVVKTINRTNPGKKTNLVWHYGNQGDNWLEENVEVHQDTQYVIFEGMTNRADQSDIAIDDVIIAPCSLLMRSAHQSYYSAGMGKIANGDVDGEKSTGNLTKDAGTAYTCSFNSDDCSVRHSSDWSVLSPVNANDTTLPCHRVHCGKRNGCMTKLLQALQRLNPDKLETATDISGPNCSKLCENNPECAAATYAIDMRKCYQHFEAVPDQVNLDAICLDHYIKPQGCERVGRYAVSKGNGQLETVKIETSRCNVHCICFYYYMDASTSSLSLHVQQITDAKTSAYYLAGVFKADDDVKKWKHANFEIDLSSAYKLRFDSNVTNAGSDVIAIDDIMVYDGSCSFVKPIVPESKAVIKNFDCQFNGDICGWSSPQNGDKWMMNKGATATSGTGPQGDHSDNGRGYYMYAEASYKKNARYKLISPMVNPSTRGWCFTVYYHMYGRNMGKLDIVLRQRGTDTATTRLERISGDQGQDWRKLQVQINSTSAFQVIIRGIIGDGSRSDIAIDNVSIIRGKCSASCSGKNG